MKAHPLSDMKQNDGATAPDSNPPQRDPWLERLPIALLVIAMVISTWLVLTLNSGFTFIQDEWDPLLNRNGWGLDQIFAPFNGHPTMIPMVIYKVFQEVFGMDSARPVQIIHAALLLVMNGVLFVYLRRRVGDWAALIGTVVILFLGAAFEILLFSFTMNFTGAIAAGIGALLALDRNDRAGDIIASLLLVLGLFTSLLVLPFIAAAAVEWYLNPRNRKDRWFVPGISILVFASWWLVWGRDAGTSSFSLANIPTTPGTAFEALGSGFMSLVGLASSNGTQADQPNLIWGQLIAIAAAALAWLRIRKLGRPVPRDILVSGAALLSFVLILGLSEEESRQPTFSRFQLPLAILILMTASTLLKGIRLRTSWLIAAALIAAFSVQSGVRMVEQEANGQWTVASQYFRAYLAGIELSGTDAVATETAGIGPWATVSPARFIEITDRYGSPAHGRSEVRSLAENELYWLDTGLIIGTGVGLDGDPPDPKSQACRSAIEGGALVVEPGRYRLENGTSDQVTVRVARVGPASGEGIGAVLPDSAAGLDLPAGDLSEPWRVSFEPSSPQVRLCGP